MSPFSFPVWNMTVGREPVLWQCLIKKCFVYFSVLWKLPFSWMHQLKSLIDFVKRQHVSYKFINLDLFGHVLSHQFRYIVYTLPAWKKENIPCFFPFSTHFRKLKPQPLHKTCMINMKRSRDEWHVCSSHGGLAKAHIIQTHSSVGEKSFTSCSSIQHYQQPSPRKAYTRHFYQAPYISISTPVSFVLLGQRAV